MSRIPFRSAPRSLARPLLATVAVVAAVLTVVGCDSRPSVAAYVNDQQVSTSSLESTVDHGLKTSTVESAWGTKPDAYRRQVLDAQIYNLIVGEAADAAGVSVSTSQIAAFSQQIVAADRSGFEQYLGRQGFAPDQGQQFLRDLVLTTEVAVKDGYVSAPQRFRVGVIEVPNASTAKSVSSALQSDPSQFATLAKQHQGPNTTPQPVELSDQELKQALQRDVSGVAGGQTFTVQPSQAPGQTFVVHVFSVKRPNLSSLPAIDRINAMLGMYTDARAKIIQHVDPNVRINPRFGQWDPKQNAVAQRTAPAVAPIPGSSTQQ